MNNNQKVGVSMMGGIATGAAIGGAVGGLPGAVIGGSYGAAGGAVAAGMWAKPSAPAIPKSPMTIKAVNDAVLKGYVNKFK